MLCCCKCAGDLGQGEGGIATGREESFGDWALGGKGGKERGRGVSEREKEKERNGVRNGKAKERENLREGEREK